MTDAWARPMFQRAAKLILGGLGEERVSEPCVRELSARTSGWMTWSPSSGPTPAAFRRLKVYARPGMSHDSGDG